MQFQTSLSLAAFLLCCFIAVGNSPYALAQDSSTVWVTTAQSPQYFAVFVEDVDASVAWYSNVFGVQPIGGSEAADGSWRIENLKNDFLLIELIRDDRAKAVDRARGFFKVGFQVPNVERVADRIKVATGERPRVLNFEEYGVRIIQFQDPDGNTIQLSSPLAK